MRFKIDDDLQAVAKVFKESIGAPVPDEKFAVDLCRVFIDAGMLEDTEENFGLPVTQAMGPQYVSNVAALLSGYLLPGNLGVKSIPANVFDSFCRLIVMGDGDCPHCGGTLKFKETVGHEINDGDYWTPNSWEVDAYVYDCPVCGKTVNIKP